MATKPKNKQPFSLENIRKYNRMANEIYDFEKLVDIKDIHVYISISNHKTGNIPSFSTLSGITCQNIEDCMKPGGCGWYCYDKASVINMGRSNILFSRAKNTRLMMEDRDRAFWEISNECYKYRYFRWHVGGEIIDSDYFRGMCRVAKENMHCQFLVFTKNYSAVNAAVAASPVIIPGNFRVVFSRWPGMNSDNPYRFPETSPRFSDGTTAFVDETGSALVCGGSCQECISGGCGCFSAKHGDRILFNLH